MAKKCPIKKDVLIEGALTILLGILFLILKADVISVAMTVLGVVLIVMAVLDLIDRNVLPAIIKAVFAVLVLVFGWVLVNAALYIVAALLLIWGIYELYAKIKVHLKGKNFLATLLLYVSPILSILIGLLLLFNQGGTVTWVFIVTGIILILDGVLLLCDAFKTKKKSK